MFTEDGECEYLKIGKFTTLIGNEANDGGKSNIIRAIHVACKNQSLSTRRFSQENKKKLCNISSF